MHRKGFVQIIKLITLFVAVIAAGSGGYLARRLSQDQHKSINNKELRASESVQLTKQEIESLLEEIDRKDTSSASLQKNNQPTIDDLAKAIVRVICSDGPTLNPEESKVIDGSGTIFGHSKSIITNFHIVEDAMTCRVGLTENIKNAPSRWFDAKVIFSFPALDIARLKLTQALPDSVSTVTDNTCASRDIKLGDEIMILGYPSLGGKTITATEGVISGFDGFLLKTSAKIDQGNSGGSAFLKKKNCWFGIPTFVTKGEFESLGSIINYSLLDEQSL